MKCGLTCSGSLCRYKKVHYFQTFSKKTTNLLAYFIQSLESLQFYSWKKDIILIYNTMMKYLRATGFESSNLFHFFAWHCCKGDVTHHMVWSNCHIINIFLRHLQGSVSLILSKYWRFIWDASKNEWLSKPET